MVIRSRLRQSSSRWARNTSRLRVFKRTRAVKVFVESIGTEVGQARDTWSSEETAKSPPNFERIFVTGERKGSVRARVKTFRETRFRFQKIRRLASIFRSASH